MLKRIAFIAGALLVSMLGIVAVTNSSPFEVLTDKTEIKNESKAGGQSGTHSSVKESPYSSNADAIESGSDTLLAAKERTTNDSEAFNEIEAEYVSALSSLEADNIQSKSLYVAEENLVQQCMNELGFEYYPGEFIESDPFAEHTQAVEPGDLEDAKNRGYGIADSLGLHANSDAEDNVTGLDAGNEVQDKNSIYLYSLNADRRKAWRAALLGKVDPDEHASLSGSVIKIETPNQNTIMWDTNSCVSAASKTLYGSDIEYRENVLATEALKKEFAAEIEKDPVFIESLGNWRDCMVSHELDYEYPGQAAEQLYGLYNQGAMSEAELKLAEVKISVVDAQCYEEHQLGKMLASVEQRIGESLAEKHAETIVGLRNSLLGAVKAAEQYQ